VTVFLENIWRVALMAGLLLCSAFFSGSETAFFNISRRQILAFAHSPNRFERVTALLLRIPNRLLTSVLLGNMTVNVSYFSLASVLSINLGAGIGPSAGAATAVIAFAVLLLFGEMLPKSLAYSNSRAFCLLAAPVCYLFVRLLRTPLAAFETILVKPAVRLLASAPDKGRIARQVNVNLLRTLIDSSRKAGLIGKDENQLLLEVLEFSHLKVRNVMRPRVDMIAADISDSPRDIARVMRDNRLTRMPVYRDDIDNIVGMISLRDILLHEAKPLAELLQTIIYVPEQKTVESLIDLFRRQAADMVIAVDEYGGVAGQVFLDDIIAELLEPIARKSSAREPIQQIGPMQYRLAGNLAIHDWAEAFGIRPQSSRLATVGGFTASLLGKIPRPGDEAYLEHIRMTVEAVHRNRIDSLIITLQPISGKRTARADK
jgi:CBS domain containing-hemolysin-like protein